MTRKAAPLSYASALTVEEHSAAAVTGSSRILDQSEGVQAGRVRRPLEDAADPSVLYLHPAGKKALRLYAVERGVKVHDLLLEAVEAWASERGLSGPWRVPSAGPPRRQR
jgi:hypothetical protein